MSRPRFRSLAPLATILALIPLTACGREDAARAVQAATRDAVELGQKLADRAAELARTSPETARAKAQELMDVAARELGELRDSETARQMATQLGSALERLDALGRSVWDQVDLSAVRQAIAELIERFRNEPHVRAALESLREKLGSLTR